MLQDMEIKIKEIQRYRDSADLGSKTYSFLSGKLWKRSTRCIPVELDGDLLICSNGIKGLD
jgi:hypothetical protein